MSFLFIAFLAEGLLCWVLRMPEASRGGCDLFSLLLLGLNLLFALAYAGKRYEAYSSVSQAVIFSVIFKCLLILWDYYGTSIFVLPNSHADSESFHWGAVRFMKYGGNAENYSYIVGWIYSLFGVQRMTAQYFNVILSLLGIDILERILRLADISKPSREKTLILAALLPNFMIMSSILIRECLISVILCFSLYMFMKWWKSNQAYDFLLAFAASFAASYFHAGAIAAAIGYAAVLILTRREDGVRVTNIGFQSVFFALLFFLGFSFIFSAFSDSMFKKFGGMEMGYIDNYIDEHNLYDAEVDGSSSYSAGFGGVRGGAGLVINTPIRMFYFLWVPMPWMIRKAGDIIAFFGSSLFYGGVIWVAIRAVLNRKKGTNALILAVLVIALTGAMIFAWGVDSAGSALRHREKFFFIYLLLFALWDNGREKDQEPYIEMSR